MAGRPGNGGQEVSPRTPKGLGRGIAGTASLSVQVFGRRDSRETRAALRFFSERRVPVSLVDLAQRAPARTELRRFAERFGAKALLDSESHAYRDAGLAYLTLDDEGAFERLLADPRLLRLPLARAGQRLSVGVDEDSWREWLAEEG